MAGHNTLSLVATVVMLDQRRLASSFASDVDDLADDDPNRSTIGIGMNLSRAPPTAFQQDACRRHARCRGAGLLAHDAREDLDA